MHQICTNDDFLDGYQALFSKGFESITELQSQFSEAFGSSFEFLDPTLVDIVEQARISTMSGPDLEERKDICSSAAFASSLQLDQIVISCFFALAEKACPDGAEKDDSFAFDIESTSFRLPKIRWEWGNFCVCRTRRVSTPLHTPILLTL